MQCPAFSVPVLVRDTIPLMRDGAAHEWGTQMVGWGIRASGLRTALVTDQRGVIGVVTQSQMEVEVDEDSGRILDDLIFAPLFPHMHADQGLDLALERMGSNQIDLLPVVSRANVHELVGIVTLQDVLDAYGVSHS